MLVSYLIMDAMQSYTIKLETVKDRSYFTKLALERYRIPASRLTYLISDNTVLEKLDEVFVEVLIKNYADPECFAAEDFASFSLEAVLEYLRRTHVLYVYKRLPEIAQSIHILQTGYDEPDILLQALDVFFKHYSKHLIEHIETEENSLFLYVDKLIKLRSQGELICRDCIQTGILSQFDHDHDDTELDLRHVRGVLRSFLPTAENQTPYRILMNRLRNFELDLHVHSRIEEEVLIPKAEELEKELIRSGSY